MAACRTFHAGAEWPCAGGGEAEDAREAAARVEPASAPTMRSAEALKVRWLAAVTTTGELMTPAVSLAATGVGRGVAVEAAVGTASSVVVAETTSLPAFW